VPRRITEDHNQFRDVVSGKIRKGLKKFIKSGQIFKNRGKNGKISINIPRIDIPHIVYGENPSGVGRGGGKKGDVIGKDDDKNNKAGQGDAEGITINLDLEEVLKFMQHELELPDLKPKENGTFEDVKIKYNNISLVGPDSLRHTRRTMLQALKRLCSTGEINKLYEIPGYKDKVKLLTPINSDKRFRQYKEIKTPSSNALIIYARDGSGSMGAEKCEIISDMCWWIDVWIKRFYQRVERMFVWHDNNAMEVDEDKFYRYRQGGGTTCSSAFKLISQQFENRFPPRNWNIYVFYFTDGDNWDDDNNDLLETIDKNFKSSDVNLLGVTQIYSFDTKNSVKHILDEGMSNNKINNVNLKTYDINSGSGNFDLANDEELRNNQILDAIKYLLGTAKQKNIIF